VTKRQIDRFFATLAAELGVPARAFVTGATAAALWGRVRPSQDIDLGLELRSKTAVGWAAVEQAVERTTRLTGIPTNVAEDIDRWGMITLLDYKRSSRLYRRFDRLEVRLLDPMHWSIGKLTRNLDADIRDVAEVFRARRVSPVRAARTWGRALRASPASTTQLVFRRNVEDFLGREGRRVWGKRFDAEPALRAFARAAHLVG
jgi:hypothetical protein